MNVILPSGAKVVYVALLEGWYVVRGPHRAPALWAFCDQGGSLGVVESVQVRREETWSGAESLRSTLGPTNTKGGRIKATTGNGRYSVTIDYPHESRYPHADAALALCWKMGWTGTLIEGGTADGSVFVFAKKRVVII